MNPEPNTPGNPYAAFERRLPAARLVQAKLLFLPTVAGGETAAALCEQFALEVVKSQATPPEP